jgi:hypothetical protein
MMHIGAVINQRARIGSDEKKAPSLPGPVLAEDVRAELAAGQMRDQMSLSTNAPPGSGGSGKPR